MSPTVEWIGGPRDGETFGDEGLTGMVIYVEHAPLRPYSDGPVLHRTWLVPVRDGKAYWSEKRPGPDME